jgi:pyruvate dehydrogenase E2 component (dihydrolipoamide acetyltransferase)
MMHDALPLSFSTWRKIAMATWRPRKDPMIVASADIDATTLLHYIDDVRAATGCHLTPAHLVGRAAAKVFEALPELNGRVAFGSFLQSPTIDCFFVVSLRTDPVSGAEAAKADLSGAVVRKIDTKPPWVIAAELADRAARIRHDDDPQFKRAKSMVTNLPPMLLRPIMDCVGFVTETLQLPMPLLGVEARPYGSILVSNVGTYGLDSVSAPVPTFCHVPIAVVAGMVTDKVLAQEGRVVVRPVLPLTISLDHRFVDGYQAATMARVFRSYLADPAAVDPVPASVAPQSRPSHSDAAPVHRASPAARPSLAGRRSSR